MTDPEDYDAYQRTPSPGDDNLAVLTSYQARKCAAIIQAHLDGHQLWEPHAQDAVAFLHAAATEGQGIVVSPATAELWPGLQALPWPPIGGPKPQPGQGP